MAGYTVIDPESVFITHLSETLKKHAHELLTREDVQQLVDRLRKTQPSLVGDVVGEQISVGVLQRVLRNLLADGIPIRDLTSILESMGETASRTKNPDILSEVVRKSLRRTITEIYTGPDGKVSAITIEPALEHQMTSSLRQEADNIDLSLPADVAMGLSQKIATAWKDAMDKGIEQIVLLCDSRLRGSLAAMLARTIPPLHVVAYDEIELGTDIEPVSVISLEQDPEGDAAAETAELMGATRQ